MNDQETKKRVPQIGDVWRREFGKSRVEVAVAESIEPPRWRFIGGDGAPVGYIVTFDVTRNPRWTFARAAAFPGGAEGLPRFSMPETRNELPPAPKSHRFDRYCVVSYGMEPGATRRACVDCGPDFLDIPRCVPRPGWRERMEREIAQAMQVVQERHRPAGGAGATRYDARALLAPVGLGPGSLVCPPRGLRGPL